MNALRTSTSTDHRTVAHVVRRSFTWHRPLMAVAALMLVCAIVSAGGVLLDPHQVLGAPAWLKPLKFSLSILIYVTTWAWLIAHLPRWRQVTHRLGTVIAIALTIEQAAIIWAAASGTTSHFNVSDPLHTVVWATMAVAITIMYLSTFVTSVAVFFIRLPTPSLTFAVRAGVVLALVGIGVAFLMTAPTPAQLSTPTGIIGAHTVGVADGGPGLPLLGWSTVGGDYRVAHFTGMHALQLLPLLALTVRAAGRRVSLLRADAVQLRLIVAASVAYLAALVLLTLQAAAGQPATHPSGTFLVTGWAILVLLATTAILILVRADRRKTTSGTRH